MSKPHSCMRVRFFSGRVKSVETGHFYFIKSQYYLDFPDRFLMGGSNRPSFYSFQDDRTQLFWIVPFTSQVEKFKSIYQQKILRYGVCNTIVFGMVMGYEKAFLIQNMCPITEEYIEGEYIEKRTGKPVRIDEPLEKKIILNAKQVLALQRRGNKIIFPDVLAIERKLLDRKKE